MAEEPKQILIAHLEEKRYDHAMPVIAVICLVIGVLLMGAEMLLDTSAVRIAAYGTVWTGWNVLCGLGVLSRRPVNYLVYRPKSSDPTP